MAGPWERFAKPEQPVPAGPWQQFAQPAPAQGPMAVAPPPAAPAGAQPEPEEQANSTLMGLLESVGQAGSTAARYGTAAATGAQRGVANIFGLPVDLLNAGLSQIGLGSETPLGGSDSIMSLFDAPRAVADATIGGFEPYVPGTAGERIVQRVGEEFGAGAVPGGAAASRAARLGVDGVRRGAQDFLSPLAEKIAVDPIRGLRDEVLMLLGIGTGAGVAREAVSDKDPTTETTSETVADLAGGLAGAGVMAGGASALSSIRDLGGALFTPQSTGERLVRGDVAGRLAAEAGVPPSPNGAPDTAPIAGAISRAPRADAVVPGVEETLADLLRSPEIASLEYARQSGPNAGLFNARRRQNAEAGREALAQSAPVGSPNELIDLLGGRRDALVNEAQSRASAATLEADNAAAALRPEMTAEARGQSIRPLLDEALGAARGRERDAWSRISGEAEVRPLAIVFDRISGGLTEADRAALAGFGGADIPSRLAERGAPVNLDEVTGLRSLFTSAIRQADAAGDPNRARILGRYVEGIDAYLDTVPELGEALATARGVSRDLNDRFTRRGTPIADALASRPSGGPVVPDSRVAPMFTQPDSGQASNIDRLFSEVDPGSAARPAVRDQVLADADRAGALRDSGRAQAFTESRSRVMTWFPEVRDDLQRAAAARDTARTAEEVAKTTTAELTAKSRVAKFLRNSDRSAERAMRGVLDEGDKAPEALDEILRFVDNDPAAVRGAKAAMWRVFENSTDASDADTIGRKIGKFFSTPGHRAAAQRLYQDDPEHLQRIEQIGDVLSQLNFRVTGRAQGTSGTGQSASIAPSTETLASRAFAVQRGVVGVPFTALNLGAIVARKALRRSTEDAYNRLLDEALLDPNVAELLLRENNPANAKALMNWSRTYLPNQAAGVAELLTPETEDDELMRELE